MTCVIKREFIEWCDIWITNADGENIPKVLLIGDSIARSYFSEVEKALERKVCCARLTTSKCIGDPALELEIALVLKQYAFALIHFNNGLHGFEYSEDTYQENFPRILRFITTHAHGAKLIWASTTPVRRKEELTNRVRIRNRIASGFAVSENIPVNDLFALVENHEEYFAEDDIHFNAAGQAVLSKQVSSCILQHLSPSIL